MINKYIFWLPLFLIGVIILGTTSCEDTNNVEISRIDTVIIIDPVVVLDTVIIETDAPPSFNIEVLKQQVFYIGVDNPIEISVLNTTGKITLAISNGKITSKGDGYYVANVKEVGTTTITISADGKIIGEKEFHCNTLPDPVASVGGKRGGSISKASLMAQKYVIAQLHNFCIDIQYPVVEFTVSAIKDGFLEEITSNSTIITTEQKALIKQLKSGDKVYFEDIRAQAPDGSIRALDVIVFRIK